MTLFEEQSVMLFENEVSANDYFVRSSTLSMIWIQTMEIALWTVRRRNRMVNNLMYEVKHLTTI